MTGGGDARGTVDVRPDVAVAGDKRRARVDADANQNAARHRSSPVNACAALERVGSCQEGEEERVTLRVHLDTAAARRHAARTIRRCSARTAAYCLGAELVEKPRRTLDVREQEGDGACRQSREHCGELSDVRARA